MSQAEKIIQQLKLTRHPEGGYFRETYRSQEKYESLNESKQKNSRNYSTCIYFLLRSDDFSAFHKIKQDEIWHFYKGSPIRLHVLSPEGSLSEYIIGNNLTNGEHPQWVVPANHWFAAEVINTGDFSLVGCTVAPGFEFDDFELANKNELKRHFPKHSVLIDKLTR